MKTKTEVSAQPTAIEERKLALQSNPDDPAAHAGLGWAHYSAGDSKAAIEVLEKACKRFPTDVELLYALGLAVKQAGDSKKAKPSSRSCLVSKRAAPTSSRRRCSAALPRHNLKRLPSLPAKLNR